MSPDRSSSPSFEKKVEVARLESLVLGLSASYMCGQFWDASEKNNWTPPKSIRWDRFSEYGNNINLVDEKKINSYFSSQAEFERAILESELPFRLYSKKLDAYWFDFNPESYLIVKVCDPLSNPNGCFALAGSYEFNQFVVDIFPDQKTQMAIMLSGLEETRSVIGKVQNELSEQIVKQDALLGVLRKLNLPHE